MTGEELFRASLALIENASNHVARRARLSREDAEDLGSKLRIRLMENNYAVLEKFGERCSLPTYLTSIAYHLFVDEWMHMHGRWRPSAEAKRLGEGAELLEKLLVRDSMSFDEAFPIVQQWDPSLTRRQAEALVARLPPRTSRPRVVAIDDASEPAVDATTTEALAVAHERAERAKKVSEVVQRRLTELSAEDRTALRLRFQNGMTIARIARMLACDQKQLYRRLDGIARRLRDDLRREGIDANEVADLIGTDEALFEFGFREPENDDARQPKETRGSGNDDEERKP